MGRGWCLSRWSIIRIERGLVVRMSLYWRECECSNGRDRRKKERAARSSAVMETNSASLRGSGNLRIGNGVKGQQWVSSRSWTIEGSSRRRRNRIHPQTTTGTTAAPNEPIQHDHQGVSIRDPVVPHTHITKKNPNQDGCNTKKGGHLFHRPSAPCITQFSICINS